MYHGWEKFLGFQQGGWQSLTYIKIKPTQLVGGYGHVELQAELLGPDRQQPRHQGGHREVRRAGAADRGAQAAKGRCRSMSQHQYAMVMDLNKCLGCQTCTMACKKQWTDGDGMDYMYWNNVETRPGEGYPRGWDAHRRRLRRAAAAAPVAAARARRTTARPSSTTTRSGSSRAASKPVMPHDASRNCGPNWDEDVGRAETAATTTTSTCRASATTAPTRPAWRPARARPSTSATRTASSWSTRSAARATATASRPAPTRRSTSTRCWARAQKCIFCYPRLEKGHVNACAAQCPGRIRFVGLLDDPESPVHKLVVKHKVGAGPVSGEGHRAERLLRAAVQSAQAGERGQEHPRRSAPAAGLSQVPVRSRRGARDRVLEGELVRAQNGEKSEVLQLLIGRDAAVRYQIVPEEIREAAPADVRGATSDKPAGPPLTRIGKPWKDRAEALPDAVRGAFGFTTASSGQPLCADANRPPSDCSGCSLAQACGTSKPQPPADGSEGPWL